MTRWRMVSIQNGNEHISSVVLNEAEALDFLEFEATMHEDTGWTVTRGERVVVARVTRGDRGEIERIIEAREFTALEDTR